MVSFAVQKLQFDIVPFEIKRKKITFTTASKRIKYLGVNQGCKTKDVKDLYLENYNTLKENLKIQISGSSYHVHG